jgi:YebC/PmpR family DNA-binding regulatory protein
MAGHSKWANIKHRKAAQDAKRGKQFAKHIRAIEVAAREAGTSDGSANATLGDAIQKAKDNDVPKDTIERAAKRGAGELEGAKAYEAVQYEGYAPGGVAVLVDCLTDNKNRTAGDVRNAFSKVGGNLAEPGAVAFLFSRRGQIVVNADGTDEDEVMAVGLDAGMEDLEADNGQLIAWCDPTDLADLRAAFEAAGLDVERAEAPMVPASNTPVEDPGDAKKVLRLMDALEDNDDVQDVWANFDIADQLLEELEL